MMRRDTRRVARNQPSRRADGPLPDGVGGTITGGPMEPIDLMAILRRAASGSPGSRAVAGAAHRTTTRRGHWTAGDEGVSLSDGSRILFSSVDDDRAREEAMDLVFEA